MSQAAGVSRLTYVVSSAAESWGIYCQACVETKTRRVSFLFLGAGEVRDVTPAAEPQALQVARRDDLTPPD